MAVGVEPDLVAVGPVPVGPVQPFPIFVVSAFAVATDEALVFAGLLAVKARPLAGLFPVEALAFAFIAVAVAVAGVAALRVAVEALGPASLPLAEFAQPALGAAVEAIPAVIALVVESFVAPVVTRRFAFVPGGSMVDLRFGVIRMLVPTLAAVRARGLCEREAYAENGGGGKQSQSRTTDVVDSHDTSPFSGGGPYFTGPCE